MRIFVVMPARDSARTLARTYGAIPEQLREHVIVGDDHSSDETARIGEELGATVIRNKRRLGYGGNLRTLFRTALDGGADIVVELHSDDQYDATVLDLMVGFITRGHFDVMQGNRIRNRHEALGGGMHWYRYYGDRGLTFFQNLWFGMNLGEWHSGLKAFRAEVLRELPLDSYPSDHGFAAEILMDCVAYGYRVAEIPVPVRYREDSSSMDVPSSISYGIRTITGALRRPPWRRRPYGSARAGTRPTA